MSGHRLSTAEIEAALIEHHAIAEAAVVGVSDELTGQAVNAFVAVKEGNEVTDALKKEFMMQVRKSIGPFAAPKVVYVVPDLPKTRSGKIMRRILRKILAGEEDQLGDITTVSLNILGVGRDANGCSCRIRPSWKRLLRLFARIGSEQIVHGKGKGWLLFWIPVSFGLGMTWEDINTRHCQYGRCLDAFLAPTGSSVASGDDLKNC